MIRMRALNGIDKWIHATGILAMLMAFLLGGSDTLKAQAPPGAIGTAPLPSLSGAISWINSPPLTARALKGKVVLVDFWDYSCINCIRSVPYIRAWAEKYKDAGLVVIGVHTPEFDVEKQESNVRKDAVRFGMSHPIAVDSDQRIWNAFHNQYWPAHYFIDGKARFVTNTLVREIMTSPSAGSRSSSKRRMLRRLLRVACV